MLQAAHILEKMEAFREREGIQSCIFAGDMNSLPESGFVQFVTKGTLSAQHEERKFFPSFNYHHKFEWKSVYSLVKNGATNWTKGFIGCLDHIWATNDLIPCELLEPVKEKTHPVVSRSSGILPNETQPSDHIPLMAKFRLV
jgi:CCR4-NOT transcription complex subunit 6